MVDQLVLVRHSETAWSAARRHTGRTDVPLTVHGRSEARDLAAALDRFQFDHAFSSPLGRARETAALAGLDATVDDDLAEWDYGDYEGRTTADIRATIPQWSVWTDPIPNGESVEQVGARVDRVIERVAALDGTLALVAHAHVLRVLSARWLDLAPDAGRLFALDTATISILGWERESRAMLRWNSPPKCHTAPGTA